MNKECKLCDVKISKNWARHLKRKAHLKNDPDQTIKPGKRVNGATYKELLSQARKYGLKGFTKWNKQQLLSVLSKAKKLLFKKVDLQTLQKKELLNIAEENNIKVTLKMRKAEIIEAVLKTQNSVYREIVTHELNFHDDIIEPSKGEREPAYIIVATRSCFIKKINATEVDYSIKVNKIMEIENAINAMISHAKKRGNYQKGDKLTIVVSNLNFHHVISTVVQADVQAVEFMNHIAKVLSSNEDLDITQ